MIGRHRRNKAQVSAEVHEAQDQLADAQDKERAARRKAAALQPTLARLEKHLAENNFGKMVFDLIKGAT